jgi:hypothetical protein
MLGYLLLILATSWGAYSFFQSRIAPFGNEATQNDKKERDVQKESADESKDAYGLNAQPSLAGMTRLMDLSPKYIPETGKHRHGGRLVVVGDVHGMNESLVELLAKVKFNEKHDHLILAGDMISKGPDSVGVVDLAMKLGATGIRGNHEDRILLAHANMAAEHLDTGMPGPSEPMDKQQDTLEEESFSHGDYKDRKLVKALGGKRIKWLKKCPVILRVGDLGDMGEVVVVHAGLSPGVTLRKQDPVQVMNMRTIKNGVPSDQREGTVWTKVCYLLVPSRVLLTHVRNGINTRNLCPRRNVRRSFTDMIPSAAYK